MKFHIQVQFSTLDLFLLGRSVGKVQSPENLFKESFVDAWLSFDLIFGVSWFDLYVVSLIIDVSSVDSDMFEFKSNASGRVSSSTLLDSGVLEYFESVESMDVCLNDIKISSLSSIEIKTT